MLQWELKDDDNNDNDDNNLKTHHTMVTTDPFNTGELSTTNAKVDHWAFRSD
jgi:hypothetical protein